VREEVGEILFGTSGYRLDIVGTDACTAPKQLIRGDSTQGIIFGKRFGEFHKIGDESVDPAL